MIKPPGIIDNTIELPGRCYAIRMMPHEVDIADIMINGTRHMPMR